MNLLNPGQNLDNVLQLYIDGASRNNPGVSGCGVYLIKNKIPVLKVSGYLGIKTNNQAEYFALLYGLHLAESYLKDNSFLLIKSDSLLLVNQVKGRYQIKNEGLRSLHAFAKDMLKGLNYSIYHVARSENKIADELANIGIDKKVSLEPEFLTRLKSYEEK